MKRVYLDHNATTPVDPAVLEAMLPYWRNHWGNPSSPHLEGQEARHAVERAREQAAAWLGVKPREIVFTSGGTEADNLGILGLVRRYGKPGGHVLVSAIEHPAVMESARALETEGFKVEPIPVTAAGILDLDALERRIRPETLLVAVMAANNETGVIQPLEAVGTICEQRGIWFHVDAVQAAGKIPVQPDAWRCHTLAWSGHKVYGPKGVGGLYVREGVELAPILHGGGHERGRRPGTENVPAVVGLGQACEIAAGRWEEDRAHWQRLRDGLETRLRERLPESVIHGAGAPRTPNTCMVGFPGVPGETLMMRLDLEGFAVSTGSACASGRIEPSHVLRAMGVPEDTARGSIRISFGRDNTEDEVEALVEVLARVVPELRRSGG